MRILENIRKQGLVAIAALFCSAALSAALVPVANVVELGYEDLVVPGHEAARFTLKPCQSCAQEELQFTGGTQYRLAGFDSEVVDLTAFRTAIRRDANKKEMLFYLKYDVQTKRVTELVLAVGE